MALELDQQQLAASLFDLSYQRFNFPPYYTWSEKADGTGNVPYLTSGGGFLQAITYGFGGLRVLSDRLRLRTQLIANTTRMALRRVQFCGSRIDIEWNETMATVTASAGSVGTDAAGSVELKVASAGGGEGVALPAAFATGQVAHVLCAGALR